MPYLEFLKVLKCFAGVSGIPPLCAGGLSLLPMLSSFSITLARYRGDRKMVSALAFIGLILYCCLTFAGIDRLTIEHYKMTF
jgi:hypothetical protein